MKTAVWWNKWNEIISEWTMKKELNAIHARKEKIAAGATNLREMEKAMNEWLLN